MFYSEKSRVERIEKFIKEKAYAYYDEHIPLHAQYTVADDPIPFQDLQRRDWHAIKAGEIWGSQRQSAWFKFFGHIPKCWSNCEVVAVIDTGSEACLFDTRGNPICGLTSKTCPVDALYRKALIPVQKQVRGGRRVELLVEAVASNLLRAQSEAILKECNLAVFRRDIWQLYHDIIFLFDLATHLPVADVRRAQALSALNKAVNLYREGGREDVELSRSRLLTELHKEASASCQSVSAVGHAHLDVAWLWPLRETVRKAGRTFSSALFYMKEYPEYIFGASQPKIYQMVKDRYPVLYEKIKGAVAEGCWEPQGAMWIEPDCNMSGGESLVRQILYGKRFFYDEFQVQVDNLWLPDTFGFSPVLPQLMRKSGLKYLITQKLCWNKVNTFPYHTFFWEGMDGSQVLAHFLPADTINGTMLPEELLFASGNFREKHSSKQWLYLFGEGDGGGGPGRHHLELARRSRNSEALPRITVEAAGDFFIKTEEEAENLPTWMGELYLETHRGTLTTRSWVKMANRKSEFLLHNLEFILSLNLFLFKTEYPKTQLERMWKILLLNQFHDILPGTTIQIASQESRDQLNGLMDEGQKLIKKAMEAFTAGLKPTEFSSPMILLINTTGFSRNQVIFLPVKNWSETEALLTKEGNSLLVQKGRQGLFVECNLPAYGFTVLYRKKVLNHSKGEQILRASKRLLENDKVRVEFLEDGSIKSIYDKEEKREVLSASSSGNRLLLYLDNLIDNDAWNLDPYYTEIIPEETALISSEVKEQGSLCVSIVQKRTVSCSEIIQEIILYKGSKIIEFQTRVDWRENQRMLKVFFPVNIHSTEANFDIQFGNIRRSNHRNTSWEAAQFEVFAHKWADLSEYGYGVALLNDCKYGYCVHRNSLELTLLRSPIEPDPQADREVHRFTYALLPHSGDFRQGQVIPTGYFLNIPPLFMEIQGIRKIGVSGKNLPLSKWEGQSFFSLDKVNVVIETVKQAEQDNALIVRVYESYGMRGSVCLQTPLTILEAMETDLLENVTAVLVVKKTENICCIPFYIKPYEIKTLKLRTSV